MKNRNILVTGGNRGIGLAIVKELAKDKENTVLLGCRNIEEGSAMAAELGDNVHGVGLNLSEREDLASSIKDILERYERVDVLINNAGVLHEGSFLEVDFEKFDESYRVNTLAPLELIRAFVPGMKKTGYGRIINVSSGWGSFDEGLSGPFSYSFSKAALNALTLTVAKDLPKNIKINSMCPGWVRTRMGGMIAPRSPEEGADTAVWLANLPTDGPLSRTKTNHAATAMIPKGRPAKSRTTR